MTTLRHKIAVARLSHDAHRLTRKERAALGIPDVRRKVIEPPPMPANIANYVWFALITAKQCEAKAVLALSRKGFVAFNPTETVAARASRMVKHKRMVRARAMLTSTVLVGFPGRWIDKPSDTKKQIFHADVPWLTVLETEYVLSFVGMGSLPINVPFANVLILQERTGQLAATRNWTAMMGQEVEISHGPFQGKTGQVVELTNGEAHVQLFGNSGVLAALAEPLKVPEAWVKEPGV